MDMKIPPQQRSWGDVTRGQRAVQLKLPSPTTLKVPVWIPLEMVPTGVGP